MYNAIPDFDSYFFWKFEIQNFDSLQKKVEKELDSFSGKNSSNVRWSKNCIIDVVDNLNPEDYLEYIHDPLHYIAEELREGSQHIRTPINDIEFNFSSPWINIYNEGSFQEAHTHLPDALAVVLFINDSEDAGQFYFLNPTIYPAPWNTLRPQMLIPEFKAGELIVFPTYMWHGVTAHRSKTPRKTMALNVKMEFK